LGCGGKDAASAIKEIPPLELTDSGAASDKPVLYALIAASDTCRDSRLKRIYAADRDKNFRASDRAGMFSEFLIQQKNGSLYSNIVIRTFINGGFTKAGFLDTIDEIGTEMGAHDVLLIYFSAYSEINKKGDLFIIPWDGKINSGRRNISPADIATKLAALRVQNILILADTNRGDADAKIPNAISRLASPPVKLPVLAKQTNTAAALAAQFENDAVDRRYVTVSQLIPDATNDFFVLDRWLNPGTLQISTLFPGSVTVSGNTGRQETLGIDSLESASLQLPEGNYSVSIIYRNNHRESRLVEVANNSHISISFTYRPNLNVRSFSGVLPSFGINIAELNPSGYRNIDQNVLTAMGMEQHRISFLAGEKYYLTGDYDRAITEYNRSISLKTNYADAYIARGGAHRKKGNNSRAIEDYTQALEYGGIRAEVYNYRGYAYTERGETDNAISDFSQALRLSRDYADAYINRAHAYYEKGDYDRAIEDYSQVIRLEPRNASAWNRRGSAWHRKGENEKAVSDFSRAIDIRPDYALAWHNRGNVWFNAGDYKKALADLDQAIKLAPSSGAYASRGNILLKLGDTAGADADFAASRR
jgi:tetratricopeptide (TPR) repeat protein